MPCSPSRNATASADSLLSSVARFARSNPGTTAEGSPNTFLCKGDFKDFALELEVKCDPALNSGIQVRSHVYEKDTPQE